MNKFGPYVIKKKKIFLGISVTICLICVAFACQIKSAQESPTWLPNDDPLQVMLNRFQCNKQADYCYSGNTNERVNNDAIMMWGVKPVPIRDGFSRFDDFTEVCENGPCGKHELDNSLNVKAE